MTVQPPPTPEQHTHPLDDEIALDCIRQRLDAQAGDGRNEWDSGQVWEMRVVRWFGKAQTRAKLTEDCLGGPEVRVWESTLPRIGGRGAWLDVESVGGSGEWARWSRVRVYRVCILSDLLSFGEFIPGFGSEWR